MKNLLLQFVGSYIAYPLLREHKTKLAIDEYGPRHHGRRRHRAMHVHMDVMYEGVIASVFMPSSLFPSSTHGAISRASECGCSILFTRLSDEDDDDGDKTKKRCTLQSSPNKCKV